MNRTPGDDVDTATVYTQELLLEALRGGFERIELRGTERFDVGPFEPGHLVPLIIACDSVTVGVSGALEVHAFDYSTVLAFGPATVEAMGHATVWGYQDAEILIFEYARAAVYNDCVVDAHGKSRVDAPALSGKIRAHGPDVTVTVPLRTSRDVA